ncbi:heat shock protein DnaJ domain protein [Cordyceps fumosorosea ARSEF 2679]|uniref:Heat shock protein DnaJ domain protein n=1 Tax=Cordyceps fumosorosea (strain ARSEF 2679) TaxID=1081104 RepID=A0A167S8J6_CORFA|nr:heat shock protein DnaJ domain protein [Cordyceps fumosorosea ARSEF 2679]OAA59367.1 heat shock protein DnaJ domain protein [Cordyceps fumosorosea ARSEF 2679]
MTQNYYEILQVEKSASESEIKAAFKRLAKIHHPDKNSNSAEATLKNAYDTLIDPFKRRQYDRTLRPVGFGPRARAPPEPPKSSFHHDGEGEKRLDKRIAELGASLDQLQVQKTAVDHDIWTEEGLLAKIKIELGNLNDKEDEEAADIAARGKREFKLTSWFTSGESAQVKEARGRRAAERNAARTVLQGRIDQAAATIAGLRARDGVLMAQIMKEMRELARLNIERESLAHDK